MYNQRFKIFHFLNILNLRKLLTVIFIQMEERKFCAETIRSAWQNEWIKNRFLSISKQIHSTALFRCYRVGNCENSPCAFFGSLRGASPFFPHLFFSFSSFSSIHTFPTISSVFRIPLPPMSLKNALVVLVKLRFQVNFSLFVCAAFCREFVFVNTLSCVLEFPLHSHVHLFSIIERGTLVYLIAVTRQPWSKHQTD